jgi:hypothetical protein
MPVLPRRQLPEQAAFWGSKRLKRTLGVPHIIMMAAMLSTSSRTVVLALKLIPQKGP